MDPILDDLENGAKNYRRLKTQERIDFDVRQHHRRLEVERILSAAPEQIDGEWYIAGYPWRVAWLTVMVCHFIDRKPIPEDPEEWLNERTGTN